MPTTGSTELFSMPQEGGRVLSASGGGLAPIVAFGIATQIRLDRTEVAVKSCLTLRI